MRFNLHPLSSSLAGQAHADPASWSTLAAPGASLAVNSAVHFDTFPSSPPREVHHAIGVAAESYERLQQEGRQLSFQVNDRSGKLTVEVHDLQGNVLSTIPASKALEIAGGGGLD